MVFNCIFIYSGNIDYFSRRRIVLLLLHGLLRLHPKTLQSFSQKYKEDEKMLQRLALKPKVCFNFRRGNIIVLKPIKRYVIRMNT